LLRTAEPPLATAFGRRVLGFERIGKRIAMELEGELFLVLHLMIAGRLRWLARGAPLPGKLGMAAFDFDRGTLVLTEAGTHKRAQLHVVQGRVALVEHNRGGLEPLECDVEQFSEALRRENHTLKRVLTDPRIFSGIGNAYSDEILHRARLSPVKLSQKLDTEETARLWSACSEVLNEWTARLRQEVADGWPEKVTAFRGGMAVHGRYGEPCPVCGEKVQRIVHAKNETNYCAHCQTGGKLLADRALSRLLRQDWPRTLEELEERMQSRRLKVP
jgi:formamidopyrimidine-DNA glycosylase